MEPSRREIRAVVIERIAREQSVCVRCVAKKLKTTDEAVRAEIDRLRSEGYVVEER